jgi:hemolysin III
MTDAAAILRPTRAEYIADAAVHALGVGFALVAAPILIVWSAARGDAAEIASVSVYAATLVAMFGFSAAYNLLVSVSWREILRRLDHGAIYLKIAGAYTPFAALSFEAETGRALLLGVWTVALIGFVVKLAGARRFDIVSIPLYLALGWAIVFVIGEAIESLSPGALTLISVGGGLYTLGVAFHLWESLPFQNPIWHLHVLAGTICVFSAVALELSARGAA